MFQDAGAEITLVSPLGGQPPLDPKSDDPACQTESTHRFKADPAAQAVLASTCRLSDVHADDFDAVFYPGGHGLVAYWAVLSLGPLLLAGGVFAAGAMLSVSTDFMNEPAWLEVAGLRLVSLGVLAGVFSTLYFAVPHCSVRLVDAGLSGLLAAAGFLVMQRLFTLYLAHFPSYTLVYGAFAVVPIFLLWLYLSWIIILLGAVVAAVLPERSLRRRPLPVFPGRTLYVALLMLCELAEAQSRGDCRGVEALAEVARVGHDEVRDVLGVLGSSKIVVRRDSGGWLLARSAESRKPP